jgi:hypothetical protein
MFKSFKEIIFTEEEPFIIVDFDFYRRWKYIIILIIFFKRNFFNCEIYRRQFKFYKNIVVVGLKYSGKRIKRRTKGFAKQWLANNDNAKCIYCETTLTKDNSTTDHIIPVSKRGNNCQVNLVVTCKNCNNERGNLEFKKYLRLKNPKFKNSKHPFV